ncbi:hypothetical protein CRM22_004929 [Opisthorchis felineus]|uniref:C2H2-type domain-containing protein n=1 Tax=Opisthorchis felineus TaxID=147828 RepID=A0A4S2LTR2_OPIFE|nr:hypothetical protein CRM22_004929 [Opisthorchis felineus]
MMETMTDLSRIDCCDRLNQPGLRMDRAAAAVFLPDCRGALTSETKYHSIPTTTFSHLPKASVHSPSPLHNVVSSPLSTTQALRPLSPSPIFSGSHTLATVQSINPACFPDNSEYSNPPRSATSQMDTATTPSSSSPIKRERTSVAWYKKPGDSEKSTHNLQRCDEISGFPHLSSPSRSFWPPATSAVASKSMVGPLNVCTDLHLHDTMTNSSTPLRTTRDTDMFKPTSTHVSNQSQPFNSYGGIDTRHPVGGDSHLQGCSSSSMDEEVAAQLESLQQSREVVDELRVLAGLSALQDGQEGCGLSDNVSRIQPAGVVHGDGGKLSGSTQINLTEKTINLASKETRLSLQEVERDSKQLPYWQKSVQTQSIIDNGPCHPMNESDETCHTPKSESPDFRSVRSQSAITPSERDNPVSLTCSDPHSSTEDSDEGMSMARFEQMTNSVQPDQTGLYFCHLCEFAGHSRQEFQDHLRSHYDYKCLKCDYTSRTEGRLKRHLKDFHSEVPPDNFSGKAIRPIRPKLQRCKQCDFMTETKDEFWRHLRVHIKEDKRLECSLCCFVTEYKHHLEYHMRNHLGSKPYKCPKCNYECVNKSMLNSHMKSHSNVYPYRCANCHYATKYCHSLKLHLAKHDHKPAVVLNADGSLPSYDNTAELMSLRRGPNVRHTVGPRGHVNDSTIDLKRDNKIGSFPDSPFNSFVDPNFMPFSHNLVVRHLMNSVTTGSSIVEPFHPYNTSFPFAFHGTPLPTFPGFLFPNPLMGPSSHLANLFNPSKFSNSFSEKQQYTHVDSLPGSAVTVTPFLPENRDKPCGSVEVISSSHASMNCSQMPCSSPSVKPNFCSVQTPQTSPPKVSSVNPEPHIQITSKPVGDRCLDSHPIQDFDQPSHRSLQFVQSIGDRKSPFQDERRSVASTAHPNHGIGTTKPVEVLHEQNVTNSDSVEFEHALDLSAKLNADLGGHGASKRSKFPYNVTEPFKDSATGNEMQNVQRNPKFSSMKDESLEKRSVQQNDSLPVNDMLTSDTEAGGDETAQPFDYECRFCEIRFRQRALFDIHMGFHSHTNPYLCNRCGHQSRNPVDFFIHLGQMAHYS